MNHVVATSSKRYGGKFKIGNIDLKIFDNQTSECYLNSDDSTDDSSYDDTPITARCAPTLRLLTSSRYFTALRSSTTLSEEEKRTLFVEFNEDIYDSVLNDTIHFIKTHENDIQRVHSEWTEKYGLPTCSVSECAQSARHYTRGRRGKEKQKGNDDGDALYSFYESLFDRMHHYIFHLYDIGLRVDTESLGVDVSDDEKEGDLQGVSVDKVFAAERDEIKLRREQCNVDLDRFEDGNNKFTIQTAEEQQAVTLTDAICDNLTQKGKNQKDYVYRLDTFLNGNSYDSDALKQDLEDVKDSNISSLFPNDSTVETMIDFLHSVELHRRLFSTGFVFDYKKTKSEMFVKRFYKSLKEEVLESGFLSHSKWKEFVVLKAQKYIKKSKRVKKMRRSRRWKKEHLYCIILYCDIGPLCTAFSATFRRKNVFENMESVISRHSKYGNFGKLLVELVEKFGINGYEYADEYENGPFYCGMNCVLNIGSFAISLKGPCSTSIIRAVALNFAKKDGIVLVLNNDNVTAEDQKFFDCSWISNYTEEAERLWIAGKYPQQIVSLILVKHAKNYRNMVRAFYLFDAMVSGVELKYGQLVNKADVALITRLLTLTVSGDGIGNMEMDLYLENEWKLFLQNKEEIILNLYSLNASFKALWYLIMFNVVGNTIETAKGNDNMFKPELISMFPSLRLLVIDASSDFFNFTFRMDALLKAMESLTSPVSVIVWDEGEWINSVWTEEVSNAFGAAGWNAEYDEDNIHFWR